MNAFSKITKLAHVAALVGLLAAAGCSPMSWKPSKMFSLDNTWPFRDKDKPREGTPSRMVCTWSDTVLLKAGQKPQRGFGGRILFYEKDEPKPILVDGQLVVYAFDETDRDPTDNKPTRRYVFPAEQVPIHMSKCEMGASYSFWLPWDDAGGTATTVGLICRFEPKGGAVVTSEQSKQHLPGTAPAQVADKSHKKPPKLPEGVPSKPKIQSLESLQSQRAEDRGTKLTSYEADVNPGSDVTNAALTTPDAVPGSRRMSATTITLPSSFQMPNASATANATADQLRAQRILQQQVQQAMQQQQAALQQQAATTPRVPTSSVQQTINSFGATGNGGTMSAPFGIDLNPQGGTQPPPANTGATGGQPGQPATNPQQAAIQQQELAKQIAQLQSQLARQNSGQTPQQQPATPGVTPAGAAATAIYQPAQSYQR